MTEPTPHDRDPITRIGLAVVGVAAAVLSFSALSDLARLCGIKGAVELPNGWTFPLAWLLPITVDVLAAVATRVWLRNQAAREAVVFARRSAWAAIVGTVVGNAYHGALIESGSAPPLLACVVVSAVPAVVLGDLVHLAVLVGRPTGEPVGDQSAAPGGLRRLGSALLRVALGPVVLWRAWRDGQADTGGTGRQQAADGRAPAPTGADSNEVLAADLRRLNAARRAEGLGALGRDAVRQRYGGLGSTRAQTVREMADRPEPPDGLHVVPSKEEASA